MPLPVISRMTIGRTATRTRRDIRWRRLPGRGVRVNGRIVQTAASARDDLLVDYGRRRMARVSEVAIGRVGSVQDAGEGGARR
jgi:hypothetical protein